MTYQGYTYFLIEEYEDNEATKRWHFAVDSNNVKHLLDHSMYKKMDEESFRREIDSKFGNVRYL